MTHLQTKLTYAKAGIRGLYLTNMPERKALLKSMWLLRRINFI